MNEEDLAYQFWKRIDGILSSKGFATLKELSIAIGVDYNTFKNWRSKNTIPKTLDMLHLSQALSTPMELLLLGKDHYSVDGKLDTIIDALRIASKDDLELVRRVLRIPEAEQTSTNAKIQKNA